LASALEASAQEANAHATQHILDRSLKEAKHKRQKERHAGSWDCPQCTYENLPYAPSCDMCQNSNPPLGTLVFRHTPPNNATFGVELELIITDGKRDGYTHEWLASELTKLGPPNVQFCGYSHETTEDWKIVTDASVRGHHDNRDLCLELVSPVLQGNDGLAELRIIMEHVRQLLGIATNRTCGFHVHIDATSMPLSVLKRICQGFVALENAFDLLVAKGNSIQQRSHRSTDENRYCRSNRIAFGAMSNRQRWARLQEAHSFEDVVDLVNPQQDRYRKLNITNLVKESRPSTIEFRLHGGVEELREAEAWVRLLLRFCDRAGGTASTSDASIASAISNIQSLPEEATPAQELQALWQLVDCPGLEQFYVLDRRLFVAAVASPSMQNNLRNTWRCKTCRKPFSTSRALSQHVEATGHA
jgi:hypothetical protein